MGRNERLDRRRLPDSVITRGVRVLFVGLFFRGRRRRRLLFARQELRERDALSIDLREAVHERSEAETKATTIVRYTEWNYDGSRARHYLLFIFMPPLALKHKLCDRSIVVD